MWKFKKKGEELPDAESVPEVIATESPALPQTPQEQWKKLLHDIIFEIEYAVFYLEMEAWRFDWDSRYFIQRIVCNLKKTLDKCDRLSWDMRLREKDRRKQLILDISRDIERASTDLEREMVFMQNRWYLIEMISRNLRQTRRKCDRLLYEGEWR